ncbi:MAG: hypothetical protein J5812_03150 [Candidatus Methanomethylophilaceae archaeon]|nr:hypothetical protein [Candidatus Methanomethylophilaceae archaeon]
MSVDWSIRFVNRPSGRTERVIPSVPSRASAVVHKGENASAQTIGPRATAT